MGIEKMKEPFKILAIVDMGYGNEGWVLNRPIEFLYRKVGNDYIGEDGPFKNGLIYSHVNFYHPHRLYMTAFGGREITLPMLDGTEEKIRHHWWSAILPNLVSGYAAGVEELKKNYLFRGGLSILPEDAKKLRSEYTGCVYPYWEYEKILNHDVRIQKLRNQINYQKNQIQSLILEVKKKHQQLTSIK